MRSPAVESRSFASACDHARSSAGNPGLDAQALMRHLLDQSIIHPEDWRQLASETRNRLSLANDRATVLNHLVELKLLNAYQADRITAGTLQGLVLGGYRIVGRIGAGGVGVVFEAEHLLLRRKVAIKVVPIDTHTTPDLVTRVLREMRAVARLDHPNVVAALDAGIAPGAGPGELDLYYFVMEFLTGCDLEQQVQRESLSIAAACSLIFQVASALDEAHKHLLIHRDIKPSNVFVIGGKYAKLLDFGLVRHLNACAFTSPDHIIGTLDYMAPEQVINPAAVDVRTDIFGLGATLFFALTGASPFVIEGTLAEVIEQRKTQPPLLAGNLRNDIPPALEQVIQQMMTMRPEDRLPTPQAVMHALLPFLGENLRSGPVCIPTAGSAYQPLFGAEPAAPRLPRILVVEQDPTLRRQLMRTLMANGLECLEAHDADTALHRLRSDAVEAALLAVDLGAMSGRALLKSLRDNPPCSNLKVIMTTTHGSADEMAALLTAGADDCLGLPISNIQLVARVKSAVKHKHAQDRTERLSRQLLDLNMELERGVHAQKSGLVQARNALVLALAKLVEYRSTETMGHLSRMQRYCATLAQESASHPHFADQVDRNFIEFLECCAPLHDIGNVCLPDRVLLKAGRLDADEQRIMQSHTVIGAETLQHVARRFGSSVGFLRMAIDIARHHHECYDGTGYPDRLAGADIPLAARFVSLADAYDSLRSRRTQRPGLNHASALQIIVEDSPGKFDPILLGVFCQCAPQFDSIFREIPDSVLFE